MLTRTGRRSPWQFTPYQPPPPLRRRRRMMFRQAAAIQTGWPAAMPVQPPVTPPRQAFRHRHHYPPFIWGITVALAGSIMYAAHCPLRIAIFGGAGTGLVIVLLTRHLKSKQTRRWSLVAGIATALFVPLLSSFGPRPALAFFAALWSFMTATWWHDHRIRPQAPVPDVDEIQLWAQTLGAEGSLKDSVLSVIEQIPGGTRFRLRLVGGKQSTQDVFSAAKRIASLFSKPITEAFPERFPDAREHEVMITLLRSNRLEKVRVWAGESIDPATGMAAIGDYPDGTPALYQFWKARSGGKQSIVVGVTGSGKSYLLYLLIILALTSGVPVIPLVMDPQEGQSLPDARGIVPYASGPDESFVMLRAIQAGITARSGHMSRVPWTDAEGIEHPGTDFFDPHHAGDPLYLFIFDEAHIVLTHSDYGREAVAITGALAKLNRKAGGHMVLASHALLLSELGDNTLRSMVTSGNAIALRTGEGFSGGIMGLAADPKLLPLSFPDGSSTEGLGYMKGPSNRPDSPMRVRLVKNPRKVMLDHPCKPMDDVFGRAFKGSVVAQAIAGQRGAASLAAALGITDADVQAAMDDVVQQAAAQQPLTAVPSPAEPPADGRTARDAILAVLTREMDRGELLELVEKKARDWGREPWTLRAVTGPLADMVKSGQVVKTPKPGKPNEGIYSPARPALSLVEEK